MTPRLTCNRGSAGIGLSLRATVLVMLMMFAVGAIRQVRAEGEVGDAARAAARAAATADGPITAERVAAEMVEEVMDDSMVHCPPSAIVVRGDLSPGSTVEVVVTCTVRLSDVTLAGFAGERVVSRTAAESVDLIRGGS